MHFFDFFIVIMNYFILLIKLYKIPLNLWYFCWCKMICFKIAYKKNLFISCIATEKCKIRREKRFELFKALKSCNKICFKGYWEYYSKEYHEVFFLFFCKFRRNLRLQSAKIILLHLNCQFFHNFGSNHRFFSIALNLHF